MREKAVLWRFLRKPPTVSEEKVAGVITTFKSCKWVGVKGI
jgi:hypothetical protein